MIRQTKTTIKELTSQYRSVLRRGFLIGAITMSMSSVANAAINVQPGTTDITDDVITTVVGNANTAYSDGSYVPLTWDAENHNFVDGTSTTATYTDPGAAPSASDTAIVLSTGTTDLDTYAGGYTISDPTANPTSVTVDPTIAAYAYTKKAADGSTSTVNLTAGDIVSNPVLSTTGYDYTYAVINPANGGSNYDPGSVNISAGAPDVTQYYYIQDGNPVYFTTGTTVEDLIGNDAAMDVFTNGYGADKLAYNTVSGNYNESNLNYQSSVNTVNNDQHAVDSAIESYRNTFGEWSANDQTYSAYSTASSNASAYNNSLANVIDTKATTAANAVVATAEQNAKDYADSLASNYDAAGSADTAEQNAKDYADSLASNYDAAGSADTAEQNAKDYVDSLASNYDAAGSADTAEQNAKDYADSLASNYDAAGSADTAESNANSYTDGKIATEADSRASADTQLRNSIDSAFAKSMANDALVLKSANAYTDEKVAGLEKDMSAGVASAVALSSVAVSNVKRGEVSVGGGYGYYNNQSAVALGAAMGLSDRWSINAGAGIGLGETDNLSFRAGTNYKFKLF